MFNKSGPQSLMRWRGTIMRPKTEAQLALERFVRELASSNIIDSVYGQMIGPEMHAWIVMRERTRAVRYTVYDAQLKADSDFLLTLHFTDSINEVPRDAELVDVVHA